MERNPDRRQVVKKVAGVVGGVATMIVLPSKWTAPVMNSIVGPALGDTLSPNAELFSRFLSQANSLASASSSSSSGSK